VQETCNFDVLYAYLTSANYDFSYDRSKNLRPKRNIKTAMQHEIMLYGIAQKEQMGFDKAVEECKHRMSRYGVTPNMLVLPPQMLLYMALAPEQKLTYKEGGPAAEARFEAGVAGFEARSFRGCGVMTSEPFEVSDDNESLQMLTRNSQIGEFYVMSPPQIPPQGKSGMYTCDIMIFDEERDSHVRVSWNEALKASLCSGGEDNGTPSDFLKEHGANKSLVTGAKTKKTFNEWAKAAAGWATYNAAEDNDYATTAATHGIDVRIIVARPFIEHTMHNVIMAVSGRDTGATLFGPADMQLSANTQVKTIEGACRARMHAHAHAYTHSALHHPLSAPIAVRRPLHGSLQGRGHQAAERSDNARCGLRGLRCGRQRPLVHQGRGGQLQLGPGRAGHPGPPLLRARRHRPLRLDARLPVLRGPVPERPARHRHERDHAPAPLGGQQRRHPRLLPGRPGRVRRLQRRAAAWTGALRRGHEGGRFATPPQTLCPLATSADRPLACVCLCREPGFHFPGFD